MNPEESLDDLLKLGRYREAVLRMECAILEGRHADADKLRCIPEAEWKSSALLLQLHGEALYVEGKLPEAKAALEQAVKGFAVQSLPPRLLETMALLARIHLRKGELAEARTLLVFLYDELRSSPCEEARGEMLRSLGIGGRLLHAEGRVKEWLLEAVRWFEVNKRIDSACETMAELIVHGGNDLGEEEWKDLEWRLGRWKEMNGTEALPVYAELLPAWRLVRLEQWEPAYGKLQRVMPVHSLPYPVSAEAEVVYLQAVSAAKPGLAGKQAERVRSLRELYPADLQLHNACANVLAGTARRLGRMEEAKEWDFERRSLSSLLELTVGVGPGTESPVRPAAVLCSQEPEGAWRVNFFGGLSFQRGAEELRGIRWKRKKARELLLYLLMQPQYTGAKEQIIDVLLLGDDSVKATKLLYVLVHQLKQTLHKELGLPESVSVTDGLIRLREDAFEFVDLERYFTLVRVADQLWTKDRGLALELVQEAYGLFGDLLPELPYLPWFENVREYAGEKQASVIRKCCMEAVERGDNLHAEDLCREWIRIRPLQEEAYRELLRLYVRSGRRVEAGLLFNKWSALCSDELGAEPSEEMQTIWRGLEQ